MVKFKENDIYALKIKNSNEKYNGRYIIIIKISVEGWSNFTNKKLFRFKLTKEKKLPTLNEIDSLEYIITFIQYELRKYMPFDGRLPFEERKKEIDRTTVYPNKYGFLHSYVSKIHDVDKDIPKNIIYIGNKKCKLPNDEYISLCEYGYNYSRNNWENFENDLINLYENNNLEKANVYKPENINECKKHYLKLIDDYIYFEKLDEVGVIDRISDMLDEQGGGRIEEDTLTYVGGEDKDPYEGED